MGISWAWGVSFAVGSEIFKTRGYIAFLIWGVSNSLAPLFFGLFITKWPHYLKFAKKSTAIRIPYIILQTFTIWINIRILSMHILSVLAVCTGLIIALLVYKYEFRLVLENHQAQYMVVLIGVLLAAILKMEPIKAHTSSILDIKWSILTGASLLLAPFLDNQFLQRAEKIKSIKPYIVSTMVFGLYISFVPAASLGPRLIILLLIISLTTSTIDSSVAAIQHLMSKQASAVLTIIIISTWKVFDFGLVSDAWGFYTIARIPLILFLLWRFAIWMKCKKNITEI